MRLFIAVPLPQELTDRVAALLPLALPAIRPVKPELMHVTLAFLGWTPDEQLDRVIEAAVAAAGDEPAFDLAFAGAGRFPETGKPRVVWLGIGEGREPLGRLAGRVQDELRARELAFDDRAFARMRSWRSSEKLTDPRWKTNTSAASTLRQPALPARMQKSFSSP